MGSGNAGLRKRKVGNGNYVWISYFHSYLNETGRAGFVMSSQASSAGGAEAEVRRRLVETGDVEVMIAVRANFFYTRTVPCEPWFLNRAQPEGRRGKVLMIDARPVYRKVTRKIYDFSPEQQQNLLAVVWLHRGETGRFVELVNRYLGDAADAALACFDFRISGSMPGPSFPGVAAPAALGESWLQVQMNCLFVTLATNHEGLPVPSHTENVLMKAPGCGGFSMRMVGLPRIVMRLPLSPEASGRVTCPRSPPARRPRTAVAGGTPSRPSPGPRAGR